VYISLPGPEDQRCVYNLQSISLKGRGGPAHAIRTDGLNALWITRVDISTFAASGHAHDGHLGICPCRLGLHDSYFTLLILNLPMQRVHPRGLLATALSLITYQVLLRPFGPLHSNSQVQESPYSYTLVLPFNIHCS